MALLPWNPLKTADALFTMQCFAGIVTVSVGHCHDKVMEAVNKQNSLLQHTTTIYLHNEVAQFAKELTDRLPGNLKVRLDLISLLHSISR